MIYFFENRLKIEFSIKSFFFYKKKKIVVLCHRLVLLEQLEKGLSTDHKVKKLGLNYLGSMENLDCQ